MLAYWERKEDFDDILKVKSFLYTVTRNKCLNHLKHEQLDIPNFSGQEEFDSGFEAAIIEQETFHMVRKAVGKHSKKGSIIKSLPSLQIKK